MNDIGLCLLNDNFYLGIKLTSGFNTFNENVLLKTYRIVVELWKYNKNAVDAFSWEHYFRFVGVLELNPDVDSICRRTRNAIKGNILLNEKMLSYLRFDDIHLHINCFWFYHPGVYFCDVTLEEMFVVPVNEFDVIIASLVFDVVAISDKMYITALTNVIQYLKVNMCWYLHFFLNCFTVKFQYMPTIMVKRDFIL